MANLNDAFSNFILPGDFPEKNQTDTVVGVLIGRVVNSTYFIYIDDKGKYYTLSNGKYVKLNIEKSDHGSDVEVNLIGVRYKVSFFNSPYAPQM